MQNQRHDTTCCHIDERESLNLSSQPHVIKRCTHVCHLITRCRLPLAVSTTLSSGVNCASMAVLASSPPMMSPKCDEAPGASSKMLDRGRGNDEVGLAKSPRLLPAERGSLMKVVVSYFSGALGVGLRCCCCAAGCVVDNDKSIAATAAVPPLPMNTSSGEVLRRASVRPVPAPSPPATPACNEVQQRW
jgi:hypothetical protein